VSSGQESESLPRQREHARLRGVPQTAEKMSILLGRKSITRVMCFANEPRTSTTVGVPVELENEWPWSQCVEVIAEAMGKQTSLSEQTRVYTATGFEIDDVSSCIQGETIHVAWDGDDFFESAQNSELAPPGPDSSVASGASDGVVTPTNSSRRSSSASGRSDSAKRKNTDLRRGSELDNEVAKSRLVMKFIIVGPMFAGKSCLMAQFASRQFPLAMSPTVGVDYNSSILKIKNNLIKIQIWDTAGQEEHRAITRAYFRNSAAAVIVYDVTNQQSFESLGSWIEVSMHTERVQSLVRPSMLSHSSPALILILRICCAQAVRDNSTNTNITMALCGNKIDLTKAGSQSAKKITTEDGMQYAKSQGMLFFETSAKEDTNVGMMFRSTAREVLRRLEEGKISTDDPSSGVKHEEYAAATRSVSAPQRPRRKKCC